jgi:membrane protein
MDVMGPIRRFDRFQQERKPLALIFATVKKFSDDQASNLAVVVAFYAFFSIFPLLLVFVTVLGYVLSGDSSLANSLSTSVLDRFPVIGTSIQGNHLKGSAFALIIGILLALWSGSGVTAAMSNALEQVWEIPRDERASFVQKKVRSLLLLFLLGALFVVGAAAGGVVTNGAAPTALTVVAGVVLSFLVNLVLFMASFHFLCKQPPGWRELLPGAVLAAVFWTTLQALGGVYIDHIKHSDSAYGVFALVLGILTWLHLGTQLTLYSIEFNTVLAGKRWPRSLFDGPNEQPDRATPLGGDEPVPGKPLGDAPEMARSAGDDRR